MCVQGVCVEGVGVSGQVCQLMTGDKCPHSVEGVSSEVFWAVCSGCVWRCV